jgi:PEP-CTERM motif
MAAERIISNPRLFGRAAFLVAAGVTALAASPAMAQVTDFSIFRSGEYEQTGPTTVSNLYYYFASNASASSDYTSATLVTPAPADIPMTGPNATEPTFTYSSPQLTLSELNADYPSGSYTLEPFNGGTFSVILDYDGTDNYAPPPALTAASYDGLSGLDPSKGYTFSFGAFSPPGGTLGIIFFTLTDLTTNEVVYSTSTENLSTTSFYVPGSDLAPDNNYVEELVFSTRDEISDPPCTGPESECPSLGEIGWDSRTEASFTTGVPEPATWALMLLGFAGLGFAGYQARKPVSFTA